MIESLSDPHINKIISGVEAIAAEVGYEIAILNVLGKESLRTGLDNFDGFIACYSDQAKVDLNYLDELGKPAVIVGNVENPGRYQCVSIDYRKGGQLAVNYLIDQGCQKIMMVTSALTNTASDLEKYLGYRDAMKKSGQALPEPWVVRESTIEAGIEIAAQMFKTEALPDGIFVTNDWVAAGFIKFLKKAGVNLPVKTTIIGFGNESFCQIVEPDLRSIDFRKELAGSTALNLLVEQISNRNFSVESKTTIIEPALPAD
nr:substrate-binding domain-containing protein [Niabella hibiscisoli]